jgi:hypothetical protein
LAISSEDQNDGFKTFKSFDSFSLPVSRSIISLNDTGTNHIYSDSLVAHSKAVVFSPTIPCLDAMLSR